MWRQIVNILHGKDPSRYTVAGLCRLFGVTKQAYYKASADVYALPHEKEIEIVAFCQAEREIDPHIGCRKLWIIFMRESSWTISRRIFEDIVREYGMMLRIKARGTRTTNSMHGLPLYPNLVYATIPERSCQIWVADITYIPLMNPDGTTRFCYLSIVMDAYSRYILGYYVGRTLKTVYSTIALSMALETSIRMKLDLSDLIHHSDRGVQYASADYVKILKDNCIRISMTENGNPKENPQAERVNSTVKNELIRGQTFTTVEQVQYTLDEKITYYNERRPHMSLNNLTPREALECTGILKKHWHSYRDRAIGHLDETEKETIIDI